MRETFGRAILIKKQADLFGVVEEQVRISDRNSATFPPFFSMHQWSNGRQLGYIDATFIIASFKINNNAGHRLALKLR